MALVESYQACPFCGINFVNFEFHMSLHENCKLMDGQRKKLGKEGLAEFRLEELEKRKGEMEEIEGMEELEKMEEALDFIDSRLPQHKEFGKYEVVTENYPPGDELEIGKTEFLEQDPVLNDLEDENQTDCLAKETGAGREEMERGLEEALNFIDSRLLPDSDEDVDDVDDVEEEEFAQYEVATDVVKGELEIGETEFLEQDPVLDDLDYEEQAEATDLYDDISVAFDAGKLKMKPPTCVKMRQVREKWVVGETSASKQPLYGRKPSNILSSQPSSSKFEVEDPPNNSSSACLKSSDERFEVGKFSSNNEVWKEEADDSEMKPEKVTLFLRTASESSRTSRTFKLNVKPGCSLGKVRSNVAAVLKVATERIVLKTKKRRFLDDSSLVRDILDRGERIIRYSNIIRIVETK